MELLGELMAAAVAAAEFEVFAGRLAVLACQDGGDKATELTKALDGMCVGAKELIERSELR